MTRRFDSITAGRKIILTTEKDAVRLTKFRQELEGLPFYVLPITPRFLFEEEPVFNDLISKFINEFKALEGPDQLMNEMDRGTTVQRSSDERQSLALCRRCANFLKAHLRHKRDKDER